MRNQERHTSNFNFKTLALKNANPLLCTLYSPRSALVLGTAVSDFFFSNQFFSPQAKHWLKWLQATISLAGSPCHSLLWYRDPLTCSLGGGRKEWHKEESLQRNGFHILKYSHTKTHYWICQEQRPLLFHIFLIENNSFSCNLFIVYYRAFRRQSSNGSCWPRRRLVRFLYVPLNNDGSDTQQRWLVSDSHMYKWWQAEGM